MNFDLVLRGNDMKRRGRALAVAAALVAPGAASAQQADCASLRAALAAPVQQDPAAAAAANKIHVDLDKMGAYAHSIGCDNQQFLFFGQAPPPQCGGLKARIAAMRAQFDALRARAGGDNPQRRALAARYNAACVQPAAPREKGFFETLFGRGGDGNEAQPGAGDMPPAPAAADEGRRGGGSQAVCVRTCDGGFFPLSFSAHSAGSDELEELCKALCPNAEVRLFTRNPERDISTAMSPKGEAYGDLPNALKYTKTRVPDCGCKPPNQSWVEALAHAEELLGEMGGAKSSDATITEQQSQAMAQPLAVKPGKGKKGAPGQDNVGVIAPPPVVSPLIQTPPSKTVETPAPDGSPRQIRVVGPNL